MLRDGFAGLTHLALCFHDCRQSAEKCTIDASVARELHLEICTLFFHVPPVFFSMFHVRIFARVDFFGALEHSQV